MQPKFISPATLVLALAAFAPSASAQDAGFGNVNQIQGSVSFAPGSVVPEAVSRIAVRTNSINLSPARSASTNATLSGNAGAYSVTVIADDETHSVQVTADLDGGTDDYVFAPQISPGVPVEPALGPTLNFNECSGAVQVNFVADGSGAPANVQAMDSSSRSETSPGSGSFGPVQASTDVNSATSSEIYPVLGDALLHRLGVTFRVGGIDYRQEFDRSISCGETVILEIRLDELPTILPGSIEGVLDLQFQNEIANSTMFARSGPFNNSGSDIVAAGFGAYDIENLMPSSVTDPADAYSVYGSMRFPTSWGQQFFRTPQVQVLVPEGGVANLGDRFVMQDAFIGGQVQIAGNQACINRLNGGTLEARVSGSGPATNGYASQVLTASVSGTPLASQLNSAYQMAIGVPDDATGNWRPYFRSDSRDLDNNSLRNNYYFYNNHVGTQAVAVGTTLDAPIEHCVVEVEADISINGSLALGSTFNNPRMSYSASWDEDGALYSLNGNANGSPVLADPRGTEGKVPACLPAGQYTFNTTVSAESETGEISDTLLRSEPATLRCGAVAVPYWFEIDVSNVGCPGGDLAELPFSMTATPIGGGGQAAHAYADINGGPASGGTRIDLCGGTAPACNTVGAFTENFVVDTTPLLQCGNTVEVFVLSTAGQLSKSGFEPFAFEKFGPQGPGCDDVDLTITSGTTASLDIHAVASQLNECGLEQTAETTCVLYDDTNAQTLVQGVEEGTTVDLPAGVHQGQCYVPTACGFRTCSFDATVTN